MIFSSFSFLFIFFPFTLSIYYLTNKYLLKNIILILSSLIFYFCGEHMLSIMLTSILITWIFGILIECFREYKKLLLFLGVIAILSLLVYFKYFIYYSEMTRIHLPLGISFYSFSSISYLVDVYRKDVKAEKSIISFAMYKTFFPLLISGPIIRYKDIQQYITERKSYITNFGYGLERLVYGLAAKVVIADNIGTIANSVFSMNTIIITPWHVWIGVISYFFQIYFDFAGYSSMVIGMALMFGFKFKENFNFPYSALSITSFWHKWHISLSNWFRDYLFIPLGGNRCGRLKRYFNLYFVFLLCGLWHGASWNFILWGLFHGSFLVIEKFFIENHITLTKLPVIIKKIYVWLVVMISWIFFRTDNLNSSISYLLIMFDTTKMNYDLAIFELFTFKTLFLVTISTLFSSPKFIPSIFRDLLSIENIDRINLTLIQSFIRILVLLIVFFVTLITLAGTTSNLFLYSHF